MARKDETGNITNKTLSFAELETDLKKNSEGGISNMNSKAFAEYITLLHSTKRLTPQYLTDKFGPQWVLALHSHWSTNTTAAQENLRKENPGALTYMQSLLQAMQKRHNEILKLKEGGGHKNTRDFLTKQ